MSTGRAQLRAGIKSVLDIIQAANPSVLAHTLDHRPTTFKTPLAFVDSQIRTVAVQHDASTRLRTLEGEAHFVNKFSGGNQQAAHEQDALADLAEDAFTANPRATSSQTLTEHVRVENHQEEDGDASYACVVVFVQGRFQEGRL